MVSRDGLLEGGLWPSSMDNDVLITYLKLHGGAIIFTVVGLFLVRHLQDIIRSGDPRCLPPGSESYCQALPPDEHHANSQTNVERRGSRLKREKGATEGKEKIFRSAFGALSASQNPVPAPVPSPTLSAPASRCSCAATSFRGSRGRVPKVCAVVWVGMRLRKRVESGPKVWSESPQGRGSRNGPFTIMIVNVYQPSSLAA